MKVVLLGVFLKCIKLIFDLTVKQCCEANLLRVVIRSESAEISADSADNLLVTMRDDCCCEAYLGGKKILRLKELILSYEIPLESSPIFGMISGGREFPAQSVQFSDIKIAGLLNALLDRRKASDEFHSRELAELARSLESHEVKALSQMYAAGKPITQK